MPQTALDSSTNNLDWTWERTNGHLDTGSTVVGELRTARDLLAPQLGNRRDVTVLLPPDYHKTSRRYPVIYMHDGQNLFDASRSFAGEWRVDETMQALSNEGLSAIVVGIDNDGSRRMQEYNPFYNTRFGPGAGDLYLDFLVRSVKPVIDSDFRTKPRPESTGLLGSSMGGLISLYGLWRHPDVFGFAGVFSPALVVAGRPIFHYARHGASLSGCIYMDAGTAEGENTTRGPALWRKLNSWLYLLRVRQMDRILRRRGLRADRYLYVEEEDAMHHETAWARRLPDALRFLLRG